MIVMADREHKAKMRGASILALTVLDLLALL
jgi:hypothetical protein